MHGIEHRLVETDIRFVELIAIVMVGYHAIERFLNDGQLAGGGSFSGPACNGGLHQIPHFGHGRDKPRIIITGKHPLQYIAIQIVPFVAR